MSPAALLYQPQHTMTCLRQTAALPSPRRALLYRERWAWQQTHINCNRTHNHFHCHINHTNHNCNRKHSHKDSHKHSHKDSRNILHQQH